MTRTTHNIYDVEVPWMLCTMIKEFRKTNNCVEKMYFYRVDESH